MNFLFFVGAPMRIKFQIELKFVCNLDLLGMGGGVRKITARAHNALLSGAISAAHLDQLLLELPLELVELNLPLVLHLVPQLTVFLQFLQFFDQVLFFLKLLLGF